MNKKDFLVDTMRDIAFNSFVASHFPPTFSFKDSGMGCKSAKPKPQLREVDFQRRYVAMTGGEPQITQQLRRDGVVESGSVQPAVHPGYAPVIATPRSARHGEKTPRNNSMREGHYPNHTGTASDDDLVMICADCGDEIDEGSTSAKCPRTGKLHW